MFTRQSLIGMLERLGVNTRDQEAKLQTKNVAAVMVTANLPAFARSGSRIDVAVSALGDAKDLTGGTLLVTPLLGADGEVYGVAQGALATGAIAARGAGALRHPRRADLGPHRQRRHRRARGRLPARRTRTGLRLGLRNPDLTTARRIADAINRALGGGARATDPRTVALASPAATPVDALARIEDLRVEPDSPAVVVIDEASGTIVMGDNVRISTVAIAQGNLTIRVTEDTARSASPARFRTAQTDGHAAHQHPGRHPVATASSASCSGGVTLRDLVAQPQRARRRPARHDQHPAIHQGRRRAAGRPGGA